MGPAKLGAWQGHRVQEFRKKRQSENVPDRGPHRTDWVVTNDLARDSEPADQEVCGGRWKVEQFHRELKQTTGIETNPCCKARIQRNHIACAILVWLCLTDLTKQTGKTVYGIKQDLLDDTLCQRSAAQHPLRQGAFCVSPMRIICANLYLLREGCWRGFARDFWQGSTVRHYFDQRSAVEARGPSLLEQG